ncbi:hypothetical protein L0222_28725 [bacterium]|nr:hypothetical protein [bacterium]MCI0604108.1 hypothetical protein [bacterium]
MLDISAEDKEILDREIEKLMIPLSAESQSYGNYGKLLKGLEELAVSEELIPALEHILEILLSTRKIRDAYGPHGEQQLLRLYFRTARGAEVRDHLKQLNQSLDALKDQKVLSLSFSLRVPGFYVLELTTDQCRLTLDIDWHGVSIHQLSVEL